MRNLTKKSFTFFDFFKICILVALTSSIVSCDKKEGYRTVEGSVWHTTYHITYGPPRDGRTPPDLTDSIVSVMRRVELSLSPFENRSLVSAVNRGDTSVVADSLFRSVFEASVRINRVSGGMFDPTVGPLIDLWGFGTRGHEARRPTQSQIDSSLRYVGLAECSVDSAGRVWKKSPGTTFNFSAITKGFGVDCVARMLRRNGVTDYMVEIGGEIALSGDSPRSTPWRIMVDRPELSDSVIHRQMVTIELTGCAIATSGNYRNFHRLDSATTIGHTIDPRSGRPVSSRTVSATVVAPDCMTADGLATAAMAMPADSARAMLSSLDAVSAMIVVTDSAGTLLPLYVGKFENMITQK
ncbi:MAG: FAD:protein FMN transferase [Clostridium sp.]|nr:FAD:protein FMN transferase [Clostridium sp.]